MEKELKKVFKNSVYRPEDGLDSLIWGKITKRKKRARKLKLVIFSLVGFASLTGFVPALKMLLAQLSQSGFYQYLAVAFSDSKALAYWKETALSITESIPMWSLIMSLALIFVFILSLRFMARNIRIRSKLSIA
jgi:hypothetical protein